MVLLRDTLRRPGGQITITEPGAPTIERDTFTCCHCGRIVTVKRGSGVKRGWCFLCGLPHCGSKRCSSGCVPFERRLEAMENKNRLRKLF